MKKCLYPISITGLLLMSLPAWSAQVQVSKIENDSKVRVVLCDVAMKDGSRVSFQFANQPALVPANFATSTLESGKICVKRDLSAVSIPTGQILKIIFDGKTESVDLAKYLGGASAPIATSGLTLVRTASGSFSVTLCDSSLNTGETVTFQVGDNGIAKTAVVNAEKCAIKTYEEAGLFLEGKDIVIKTSAMSLKAKLPSSSGTVKLSVAQAKTSTGSVPTAPTVPNKPPVTLPSNGGTGSRWGNGTVPTPTTPTAPPVAVDNREFVDQQKVELIAKESAKRYVKAVVKSLGQIEKIRRNVHAGFRSAENTVQTISPDIKQTQAYATGAESIGDQAAQKGLGRGKSDASQYAAQIAAADVASAIDRALAEQQSPNFQARQNLQVSVDAYKGSLDQDRSVPSGIEARLNAVDKNLQADLKKYYVPDSEDVYLTDLLFSSTFRFSDLFAVKEYNYDLLLSGYRGENAFNAWKKNDLRSPKDESNVNFYNKIIDANRVKNTQQSLETFVRTFVNAYDANMTQAWNNEVLQDMGEVKEVGRLLYLRLYQEMAMQMGQYDRWQSDYRQSTIQGFASNLESAYSISLAQMIAQSQTSAFMSDVQVNLIAHSQAGYGFTIGDQFGVILEGAVNRGMKEGTITVSLGGQLTSVKSGSTVLGGLKKLQQAESFNQLGYIADVGSPDQVLNVEILVSGRSVSKSVQVTFEALVARLGSSTDASVTTQVLTRLTQFLTEEWTQKNTMWGNGYDDNDGTLLLERFAKVVKVMNSTERQNVKKFKQEIEKTINNGDRPGFFGGHRDDYDSAFGILKASGLLD